MIFQNKTILRLAPILFAIFATFLFVGCGQKSFPLEGFKSVKFGMSAQDLEKLGLECSETKRWCWQAASRGDSTNDATLFGMPAEINAYLSSKGVETIHLWVKTDSKSLAERYSEALGDPKRGAIPCEFDGKCNIDFWQSESGNSIMVPEIRDSMLKSERGVTTGPMALVVYQDKGYTKKLLDSLDDKKKEQRDF